MIQKYLTISLAMLLCSERGSPATTPSAAAGLNSTNLLLPDVQVSTFLKKGEPKIFYYWSSMSKGPLSMTLSPCTAAVRWSVHFQEQNDSSKPESVISVGGKPPDSTAMYTLHTPARRGLFSVQLEADADGGAAVYVSTEVGGPQPLQQKHPPLRLQHRQRRTQLTVKWNQSLVDPHVTNYCLVVSQKRNYTTLCEALEEQYGPGSSEMNLPDLSRPKSKAMKRFDMWEKSKGSGKEPFIVCVGTQTQYTLTDLEHGNMYHFNLFAINRQTNFTYPFGSAVLRFNTHVKPTALRDGKSAFVNLKKLDGKAVFRYKVSRHSTDPLYLYVMPCGGAVEVEVTLRSATATAHVEHKRRIDGYGKIVIQNPARGQRYYIKVTATNREELKRISGLEVLASTRPPLNFPLPLMPSESSLHEYTSLRQCDSVTIAWLPAGGGPQRYCLITREGRLHETGPPNHCHLDQRMHRQDFVMKSCQNIVNSDKKVITQKITRLKSGRKYVIQVTVKKPKGKTLSYDLLQVQTKKYCNKS